MWQPIRGNYFRHAGNLAHSVHLDVGRFHQFLIADDLALDQRVEFARRERHLIGTELIETLFDGGIFQRRLDLIMQSFGSCGLSVPTFNEKIRSVPHCSGKT